MKMDEFAWATGAVVVGVLIAGFVMSKLRGDVDLIAQAHSGYDS